MMTMGSQKRKGEREREREREIERGKGEVAKGKIDYGSNFFFKIQQFFYAVEYLTKKEINQEKFKFQMIV